MTRHRASAYEVDRCAGTGLERVHGTAHRVGATTYSDSAVIAANTAYSYACPAALRDEATPAANVGSCASTAVNVDTLAAPCLGAAAECRWWSIHRQCGTGLGRRYGLQHRQARPLTRGDRRHELIRRCIRASVVTLAAAPELTYSFTVPNGSYQVRLHFAENYSGAFGRGLAGVRRGHGRGCAGDRRPGHLCGGRGVARRWSVP